jgi:hypothetical protein
MKNSLTSLTLAIGCSALIGCSSAYFGALEKLGYHKRDILVSRVEKARDSQQDAKEQFKTALERFEEVVAFEGGELESRYKKLDSELQRSEKSAKAVRDRIASVEKVGEALFDEWETELKSYSSDSLRRSSEQKLRATKARYEKLVFSMNEAESKLEPVLMPFRDQVLFLKHNLNAKAIASLQEESYKIEANVRELVLEMEQSIAEADAFIRTLEDA